MARNWATALVGFLFLVSPTAAGTMVEDAFDDGTIDPSEWQLSVSGSGSVLEADGVLKVAIDAGAPGADLRVYLRSELAGDFDVWSSYLWVSGDHRDYGRSGLHLEDADTGDMIARLYCYDDDTEPLVYFIVSGESSRIVRHPPLQSTLRLARTGSTLCAYYGEQDDWRLIWLSTITLNNVAVALFANNLDSSPSYPSVFPSVEAHWDDFHAEATGLAPEPSALAILGLGAASLLAYAVSRRDGRWCSAK